MVPAPVMWELHPVQLLLALALDFLLGNPKWMPGPDSLVRRLQGRFFRSRESRGNVVTRTLPLSILVAGVVLLTYLAVAWILPSEPQWLLEVFVLYQALTHAEFTRTVKEVLRLLNRQDVAEAAAQAGQIPGLLPRSDSSTPERVSEGLILEIGESVGSRLVAPLFWAALLGAPGALALRLLQVPSQTVAPASQSEPFSPRFYAEWIPARLVAVLSETFRRYRSFGKVRREARRIRGSNRGWGAAAIARDLDVRLEFPIGDEPSDRTPMVYHPEGSAPSVPHLAEALSWHWRITAFSTVLALLALF